MTEIFITIKYTIFFENSITSVKTSFIDNKPKSKRNWFLINNSSFSNNTGGHSVITLHNVFLIVKTQRDYQEIACHIERKV